MIVQVDVINEYRWFLLIGMEVTFWLSLMGFFITRYWFQLKKISRVSFAIFIGNEVAIFTLGVLDYINTGKVTNYQVIILILLIYALTSGKKDFRKLDAFIERKIKQWRGEKTEALTSITPPEEIGKPDMDYAKREVKTWLKHVILFLIAQIIFLFLTYLQAIPSQANQVISGILDVWTVILVIDTVISLSYLVFPRKKK
ncbi:hypothetical protein [Marininema halotolerans]|uniref:Integral membrane protein n=1 Tax=Marininema halotolerans TaxID=1155944 RepID=A0A1I6QMW5_9BACL|nr:hypothetical protein [Marininema halotolerans]SFS53779.1 hypothetical protein SAMN05444972_103257 [Marininema halotolerans]